VVVVLQGATRSTAPAATPVFHCDGSMATVAVCLPMPGRKDWTQKYEHGFLMIFI